MTFERGSVISSPKMHTRISLRTLLVWTAAAGAVVRSSAPIPRARRRRRAHGAPRSAPPEPASQRWHRHAGGIAGAPGADHLLGQLVRALRTRGAPARAVCPRA